MQRFDTAMAEEEDEAMTFHPAASTPAPSPPRGPALTSRAPRRAPVVCDEGFVLGACTLLRAAPETHGRGAGCQVPGCVR